MQHFYPISFFSLSSVIVLERYTFSLCSCFFLFLVAQSCLTLCNPMDCSSLGSSVHEILQARILEWVAISFFRRSSLPRDQTLVSHIAGIL